MIKQCLTCSKKFYTIPFWHKKGYGKYCSRKCSWIAKKGKPTWIKGRKLSEKSRKLISKAKIGINNPSWKGGRYKHPDGYIYIKNRKHSFCSMRGYVAEHRLVMEKHLGRYLKPTEIVHHINNIRDDNRISNLELFKNLSEHIKFHIPKGTYKGEHHSPKTEFKKFN